MILAGVSPKMRSEAYLLGQARIYIGHHPPSGFLDVINPIIPPPLRDEGI